MQVVTSENLAQFVQTGSVPEFKAPDAKEPPKAEAKPGDATTTPAAGAAPEAKADDAAKPKDEPARDSDGKFVKAGDEKPAGATDDAEDDAKLTEKIRRIIGKKHRAQREAEEFATNEGRRAIEAERRAEQLQREIDALKGTKSEGPGRAEGKDEFGLTKPKQADFKTVGDFTEALVEYEANKAAAKGRAQATTQRQQEQANVALVAFGERQDAFRKDHPDYDDVVSEANLEVPAAMTQYLIESESGPALMLHLSQNPAEVTRLLKLSPSRQVAELGKLETRFEKKSNGADTAATTTSTAEVSKAPAPIAPLEAKTAPVQKDPSKMSLTELREFRRQEALAKASR